MKRRTFCGSVLASIAATTTSRSVLGAIADALHPIDADIPAVTGAGKSITLPKADVETLRRSLRGLLLVRGDDGYERARKVWNGAFDRRPALIARCTGAADVAQAVSFARAHDVLVSVRGGGHSVSGQSACENGLMIDLAPMKSVRVDPAGKLARAEPGVLLGELDRETQFFGLATPAGTISHTGIAGLTLGGGTGRLARKYGLSCDNLASVDVVTADGRLLTANAQSNADLFWAVRGGGGNFGIVTSFEYRLHAVGPVLYGGKLIYPIEHARAVLEFFAGYATQTPDELFIDIAAVAAPEGPSLLVLDICHCGGQAEAERALAPLLAFRKPLRSTLAPTAYVDLQGSNDAEAAYGVSYYVKSGLLDRVPSGLIDAQIDLIASARQRPAVVFLVDSGGGAVSRVAPTATAFVHRAARHTVILQTMWRDRAEAAARTEWARAQWRAFEPHVRGFYSNINTLDQTQRQVSENYGVNFDRLSLLKRRYDPGNLFRLNANIPPAA